MEFLSKKKNIDIKLDFLKKNKFFDFLKKIKKAFPNANVYLVGGAVRDLFLSRQTKDYDFVIRKVSVSDLKKFLSNHGTVNLVGHAFGVFKFIPSNGDVHDPFDIALPRKDFSLNTGGYRDVEIQTNPELDIKEDLSRRDFTINAMAIEFKDLKTLPDSLLKAFNTKKWKLIDPFNGIKDVQNKIIRAVGKPDSRFKEDYSRMLRGIRFVCELGFNMHDITWKAIKNNIKGLNKLRSDVELVKNGQKVEQNLLETRIVPYEVIAKEFLKAFIAEPVKAFDLYDQSNAFKQLMPEILKMKKCPQPKNFHSEGDVWQHTRLALEKLNSKEFKKQFKDSKVSTDLILSTLFHDIGKPYTIQTPEKHGTDRIRFNEHDVKGAEIAKQICYRLKLSSPLKIGINVENVIWLVKQHLILARGDISKMKPSTIERYFFNKTMPSEDLLKLSFVDISATVPPSGKPDFTNFYEMTDRMNELKSLSKDKKDLPKPIINGHEIMRKFKLKPGPKIGKVLELIREQQLQGNIKNKANAVKFLKKHI